MTCPQCGSDCMCACSGDPLPQMDWRREVRLRVRAHRVRRHRRLDPNAPLLEFEEQDLLQPPAVSSPRRYASADFHRECQSAAMDNDSSSDDSASKEEPNIAVDHRAQESGQIARAGRLLDPFPRISVPVPRVIEFPRGPARNSQSELAEPVVDQLRIFEAVEEVHPTEPTHLSEIELTPEKPLHTSELTDLLPLQAAPLKLRAYAAIMDAVVVLAAFSIFAAAAGFVAGAFVFSKSLMATATVCNFLLMTLYYLLALSCLRNTVGARVSGLSLSTFSGTAPSTITLRWRALAILLSFASLGMGFVWSLLDEDRLCWHDRITRTYLRCSEPDC